MYCNVFRTIRKHHRSTYPTAELEGNQKKKNNLTTIQFEYVCMLYSYASCHRRVASRAAPNFQRFIYDHTKWKEAQHRHL